ncbi:MULTISPECIES: type IV pilus biogenesis protein PilM [Pseudomonas]|uniref:Pilus assembly protein PilM n=1 Tax=Pseudomonas juntendi TaxID=2666183 RepID=A0A7W2LKH4_9PSED|nr:MULTISPECIES: pilus assembly protein PilM [Pseudomonas]NOY01112.1 pilus assembly protein PilM [Gammaproteobacteria bacterium]OAK52260.1 pilus assembly protein PilM [Pseudomonas putida]PPB14091.1 pilus assembly protein PilM [Pseudomonas aeruginosa]MBA6142575.1 pilus assembly protein PilM [Pseudomonas juntendi]MCL8329273.1 pilus assembly protein PilM [Pseudomonas juntendi]
MLGRFGKDAGSLVGVEITAHAIHLVQLQQRKGGWRVLGWAHEPLQLGAGNDWAAAPEQVSAALQRAHRRSGLGERRLALALPASQVICKLCHLPLAPGEEQLEAQLLADAERLFPFPLEDLALDFQVLGASGVQPACSEVLVAACRQSALAPLEALVQQAGLQLEAVEVDSIALRRMLPAGEQAGAALLRIEPHRATVHAWAPGGALQRRELRAADGDMAAQLPERLPALLAEGLLPARLWVSNWSPLQPGWLQALGQSLALPCQELPALAGLAQVDGPMLLASALALGGARP